MFQCSPHADYPHTVHVTAVQQREWSIGRTSRDRTALVRS